MRNFLILATLITVAIFALWLQQDSKLLPRVNEQETSRFPDYFMDNFSITSMNTEGSPGYTLQASKMLHYSDDDSAELTNPVLTFHDQDKTIRLQAKRAQYLQQQNLLHLYDDVSIQRSGEQNKNELTILTDYLKIDTQSRIAHTDHMTRIQTTDIKLSSKGLTYDNRQGILTLNAQVKGIYERP